VAAGYASTRAFSQRIVSVCLRLRNEPHQLVPNRALHDRLVQGCWHLVCLVSPPTLSERRLAFTSALLREAVRATKAIRRDGCVFRACPGKARSRATVVDRSSRRCERERLGAILGSSSMFRVKRGRRWERTPPLSSVASLIQSVPIIDRRTRARQLGSNKAIAFVPACGR
jgi:hypothetical protein